jgi:hypothetical protein
MFFVSAEPERICQPWELNPRRLVTWWDMLHFAAWNFFWCGHTLQFIEQDCLIGSIAVPGDTPILNLSKPLDEKAKNKALPKLKRVAEEFEHIGLRITAAMTSELVAKLEDETYQHNFQWLIDKVKAIGTLSMKEIEGKAFLYVSIRFYTFPPNAQNSSLRRMTRISSGRQLVKRSQVRCRTSVSRGSALLWTGAAPACSTSCAFLK